MPSKITYHQFRQQKVAWSGYDVIDVKVEKPKYKPKVWEQSQFVTDYMRARDMVIYKTTNDEQSRLEILERYGK